MIPNQNENYLTSIFFVITACCIILFGEVSAEVSLDARSIGLGGQLASSSYGASGLFNNPATVAFLRQSAFLKLHLLLHLLYKLKVKGHFL